MQARIEQGCLKLKADTDEEKALMRKFYDSFVTAFAGGGLDTDFAVSPPDADQFFLYIRPAPKIN